MIRLKTNGRCAYCGCELPQRGFHVDHVAPIYRGRVAKPDKAGADDESNMLAACARCNRWKKTFTVDEFREEVEMQVARLRRDSAAFRLAEDFRRVTESKKTVVFYFEELGDE